MYHITFPFFFLHALCVMDAGTAQPTVGHVIKVVQKCVFFMKISRSSIQILRQPTWPTLCEFKLYFHHYPTVD